MRIINKDLPANPITHPNEVQIIPQQLPHHSKTPSHDDLTQKVPTNPTSTDNHPGKVQPTETGDGGQTQQYQPPASQAAGPVQIAGGDSFGPDDYPDSAIASGESGFTLATYSIGTNGRVTSCTTNGAPSSTVAGHNVPHYHAAFQVQTRAK